jgi:FG-GAP-like repeat
MFPYKAIKRESLGWYVVAAGCAVCAISEKTFILDGLRRAGRHLERKAKGTAMKLTPWASVFIVGAFVLIGAGTALARQFKHAIYYNAGSRPYQVAAAHLTNSGNLDLVVADYLSNQMVVLLGKGDGTFQSAMKFSVPAPIGLALGDLNHDGKQDLLVVESGGTGTGALAIFLGRGDGKFSFKASYLVGSEAGFVTVADFDGDGKLDVAETDAGDGSEGVLRIFRGTGKGTLLKPTVYKIPDTPGALAAADLNGDQHPDLALVQYASGSVGVLINDGTGKFLKPVTYNAGGGEVVDVNIADLRNNGKQDLVIANGSQGMVVLLNKGDGTFGPAKIYPPCAGEPPCEAPNAVVVADFNLDGHLDAAVATNIDDSYFYYGKGDGTFGLAKHLKDTIHFQGGFSIAAGDFNNDQAPDLAIPVELKGKVAILLNGK